MRLKPKFWWSLSLLFFAAAVWLWEAGERRAALRGAAAVSGRGSVGADRSDGSASTVPAPAAARSYRLSNTTQPLAQLERNSHAILLRNALIDTSAGTELAVPEALRAHGAPGSYLVQSARPLDTAALVKEFYAALSRDGAVFISYIPNNAALVRASEEAARTLKADGSFEAVLAYEPYFKLDATLLPGAVNGEALTNNLLRVTILPGQDDAAEQALAALGANVTDRERSPFGSTTFIVTAPADQLVAVAQLPEAQEIEPVLPRVKLNDQTRERLGVAVDTVAETNYQGLTGTNIFMGLADTGVDTNHLDFSPAGSRLLGATGDPDGHGTFVAAEMMGGGNESSTVTNFIPGSVTPTPYVFRGMAPKAGLFVQQVDLWTGVFISDYYLQSNASYMLTSNALALNTTNAGTNKYLTNGFVNNLSLGYQSFVYDLHAASYDLATRNSQPGVPGEHAMLFVVAAGNGNRAQASILSPATAKNVVTVGAITSPRFITNSPLFQSTTYSSNAVAPFSGGGNIGVGIESDGGRFKPDVVAPGCFTISARAAGFKEPTQQEVMGYASAAGQTVSPGQADLYQVTLVGQTTNVIIQVAPNQFSPVPFPTNVTLYFDTNNPPTTRPTGSNSAGVPEWANPFIGVNNLEVFISNQPWPVAYDLRVYGIGTNNGYSNYYPALSNLDSSLLPHYRYESGTSMAAGAVSGMLGLMQDFLHNKLSLTPSPALLKALLINGSRPLNQNSDLNPAPTVNLEGYGLPNLRNSIPTWLTTNTFFDQNNALQTGESHSYTVNISTTVAGGNATNYPLRITLVWTDPPGNPAAGLALVNNLQLVVTDASNNVYLGNNFLSGDIYTETTSTEDETNLDNNVENVFIDATYGLLPPYTVSVQGTRVYVNADTTQTNIIGQDYALVISSDYPTNVLTVSDGGTTQQAAAASVNVLSNGMVLMNQRVGANEPNTNKYPGGGLYAYPGNTNGNLSQWQFYTFSNINYLGQNTNAFLATNSVTNGSGTNMTLTSTVTNLASLYTNAIIATFLPATLTIPVSSPVNLSYPAAGNADIDVYVSTNPALTNLDTNALAGAQKGVGQGGNETVLFTNVVSNAFLYIAVKSETQQGANFDMFATLATNFDNGYNPLTSFDPITVSAYALPMVIPDDFASGGEQGAQVIAFVTTPITVRKVQVTVGVDHENPADLYGTLTHGGQQAVLNHLTGEPGGFTNTYDDLPEGETSPFPIVPSDGPGTLENFVGLQGSGQWILNEKDSVFTQTGIVTMLSLTIWPQPPESIANGSGLDFTNIFMLETNGVYYGYVDVPDDATNMEIGAYFTSAGPVGVFLTNQAVANTGDYGTNVITPGSYLDLSSTLPANWPATNGPALSGGVWYYLITNESGVQMFVTNFIVIQESGTPNLTLSVHSPNTNTPLAADAHTQSQICFTNGIWTNNQQLASLQVGVCLADTNAANLVIYVTSPQGTSTELFENRGGPLVTNLGLVTTNGYVYLTFTDNSNLAPDLVKFFPPPFGQLPTNVYAMSNSFETVSQGDYGQSNALLANIVGTNVEGWTVASNDVAVVGSANLYRAAAGSNYMALADGAMRTNFGTVVGQGYTLTFNYRGPGLVDWWQFEGTPNDSVGAKNGTPMSVPVNYGTGEVEMGIQFPTNPAAPQGISFGTTAGNFGTNDFTIDYWMKTASTNAGEEFMEQGNTCRGSTNFWAIDIGNSNMNLPPGTPYLIVTNGTNYTLLPCTTNLIDSNWHHLAWVRKGTGYYLYLDGTNNNLTNSVITNSLSNGQPLILGNTNCFSTNGPVPYTGAVDELDIWNRALTDVEIAAIFEAGAFGKGTPVSILPNCGIVITSGTNSVTRTLIATNASSTNWLTNMVYFTAVGSNTTITLQGNPLGMLFDNFVVETPANLNFVQPEESLAPLIGQNPYGCWTLDVWDTRLDTTSTNNGVLYSWNLQMSVSSTNTSMIVLTNGYAYRGSVSAGGIAYFAFDVPAGANYVTNSLFNCLTNGFPAPLNLLFNQIALPVGNGLGDYTLLRNATNSASVLSNNAPPPALLPGARYYLGVQNTNSVAAAFSIEVWTNVPTATNIVALNFGYYSDFETISNAPEYYSFYVQPGTTNALFEIASTHYSSNELVLYIRHDLPLPTPTTYDYESSYFLTNGSPIVVSNTSTPVPLTSGTWYLAVYNSHTNVSMTYQVYGDTNVTTAPSAAVVSLAGMSAADNQFTLSWASVPGGEYKVNSSTDLTNWTEAADVTTDGATGTYNEDMIQQSARFYQVTRVR